MALPDPPPRAPAVPIATGGPAPVAQPALGAPRPLPLSAAPSPRPIPIPAARAADPTKIVVVLGLWYISAQRQHSGIVLDVYADDFGEQLLDSTSLESIGQVQDEAMAVTPDNLQPVDDPFAPDPSQPKITLDNDNPSTPSLEGPSISIALAGREEGTKEVLLGKYGGHPNSEAAVTLGLA